MTQTRRIILNVVATHSRSLFTMVCGFMTGRWALMALGAENYGLLGLIGGLAVLFTFLNSILSTAISRFYAFSIGENKDGDVVDSGRRWFNVAFSIHITLALGTLLIGYPIGIWLIKNYLTIPLERIDDCVWVLRFVAASAVVSIASVPFRALYTARQYIAELTIYSVFQTAAYTGVLYYMVCHPNDWLVWLSAWLAFQSSFVNILITIRSFSLFPECRIRFSMMLDKMRFKALACFSGWQMLGNLGRICRDQGMAVVVNKCFGPAMNASYTVSWTLAGRAQTFANEVDAAFSPAITTAYGAGDRELMDSLVHRCSKFSACLVILVVVPLVLQMQDVLMVWLKNPPPFAVELCSLICIAHVIQKLVSGQFLAITATGNIRARQIAWFITLSGTIPVALSLYFIGIGIVAVGYAFLAMEVARAVCALKIAQVIAGVPITRWVRGVLMPIAITSLLCAGPAFIVNICIGGLWAKLCGTTFVFCGLFMVLTWFLVLDRGEKLFILNKASAISKRFR